MRTLQARRDHCLEFAALVCLGLLCLSAPAMGEESDGMTSFDEVQSEFSEAFAAIGEFTAQERDEALDALNATLDRLDDRIEETEAAIRNEWSDMSQATREQTAKTLKTLRERRNELSKAVGALSQGVNTAWGDLMSGVRDGWTDLERAWDDAAMAADDDAANDDAETGDADEQ